MDHPVRLCVACQSAPVEGRHPDRPAHLNAKYCAACRQERRHRPRSNVTPARAAQLRQLVGQVAQREIQQRLGLSKAAITRWLREQGLRVKHYNAPDEATIEAVYRV